MSDPSMPQVIAALRAIEERLTALIDAEIDPAGRTQQSQNDTLRTYGIAAQIAEVIGIQRDQIQALADTMSVYLAKVITHDRRMIAQHAEMLSMLEALAHGVGMREIAMDAEAARAKLQSDADERLADIAHAEDRARELLSIARMDAIGDVRAALNRAEAEIAKAATAAVGEIDHDADTALGVIADSASAALGVVADAESAALDVVDHAEIVAREKLSEEADTGSA